MSTEIVKHVDCICSSPEHIIRFVYFPQEENECEELYVDVQLNQNYSFFKRILLAIKYVLGYSNNYGHWDSTLIAPEDLSDLIKLFKRAEADHKQYLKKMDRHEKTIDKRLAKERK